MSVDSTSSQPGPEHLRRLTRSEWVLILALAAIQFTHIVDFVILMPLGDRLMHELAISPRLFSFLVAAYALTASVMSLLAASVIDRFDRRSVVLFLYAGFGVSTLCCGLAPNYELLLASRAMAGAFGGLASAAIMAVIGDVFPDARRGRATGVVMSAFAVASIAGLPAGLALAAEFGRGAPFLTLAALCVPVWIVVSLVMPSLTGHRQKQRRPAIQELRAVISQREHLPAFLFNFTLLVGTFTVGSFIGPIFIANGGFTEHDLAVGYAFAGLLTFFSMNIIGRLSDRMNRLKLFRVLGLATIGMTLVITNVVPSSLWVGCVMVALFMGCASGRMIPAQAMLVGVPVPAMRGGFMSVNTAVQHLGSFCAPMLAGAILTKTPDGRLDGYPLVGLIGAIVARAAILRAGRIRPAARATPTQVLATTVEIEKEPVAV